MAGELFGVADGDAVRMFGVVHAERWGVAGGGRPRRGRLPCTWGAASERPATEDLTTLFKGVPSGTTNPMRKNSSLAMW
jgi:hypothetical protein